MEPVGAAYSFVQHPFLVHFTYLDPDGLEEYHTQLRVWCVCLPRVGDQVGTGVYRRVVTKVVHTLEKADTLPGGATHFQVVNVLLGHLPGEGPDAE